MVIPASYIPSTHNGVEVMIQPSSDLKRCAAYVVVAKIATTMMIHQWSLQTLYKLQPMLQLLLPKKLKTWLLMHQSARVSLVRGHLNYLLSLRQLKNRLDMPVPLQIQQKACFSKQMLPQVILIRSIHFYSQPMDFMKPPKMLLHQQMMQNLPVSKTSPP